MIGQSLPRLRTSFRAPKLTKKPFDLAKKRFKSLRKLGSGAFGTAFSGKLSGQSIIIKVATGYKGLVPQQVALRAMAREVVILERLQSLPFVPRLIEVGPDFFILEDAQGVTFLSKLVKGMDAASILSVTAATGIMISQIHKLGVAHNDLFPRNILLTPQGVVIIDFGISVTAEQDGAAAFVVTMAKDILALTENLELVLDSPTIPEDVRIIVASVMNDTRDRIIFDADVSPDTGRQLATKLLFALAQLGARAVRGGKVKREKVRVVAV